MYQVSIIFVCTLVAIANAKSPHVLSIKEDSTLHTNRPSGKVNAITSKELPILKGLSIRRLVLEPSAVREPHWHANANELTYCLRGSALVTIFGNGGEHSTFTITEGQMFFVPSGYIHHIENINLSNDTSPAEFIIAFSHELPEDFQLSSAVAAMTDAVLGNTFQLPASAWKGVVKKGADTKIGQKDTVTVSTHDYKMYGFPSPYKFDIEKMSAPTIVPEGWAKKAIKKFWPVLDKISMFSLVITSAGMREPHWHPETAEMGYVIKGHARMTILQPSGDNKLDTYTLKAGDVYFIPRAYPHHIEVIADEDIHFLVFFDQAIPGDIGYTGIFTAYSREVLGAAFQSPSCDLPNVPYYPEDLLIVKRVNPVDP